MKYALDKNRLKEFIKKKLGVDLTGKVTMITSTNHIPISFSDSSLDRRHFRYMMNNHGPFYLIKNPLFDSQYLVQKRSDVRKDFWFILRNDDDVITNLRTSDFLLKELGLDVLGINLETIMDIYLTDEEDMLESITESKKYSSIESLVDKALVHLKKLCDDVGMGGDAELITICDLLDSDLEVKVNRINTDKEKNKLEIYVDITYRSVAGIDVDYLLYEINWHIEKWLGVDCDVISNDIINRYFEEDPQW